MIRGILAQHLAGQRHAHETGQPAHHGPDVPREPVVLGHGDDVFVACDEPAPPDDGDGSLEDGVLRAHARIKGIGVGLELRVRERGRLDRVHLRQAYVGFLNNGFSIFSTGTDTTGSTRTSVRRVTDDADTAKVMAGVNRKDAVHAGVAPCSCCDD